MTTLLTTQLIDFGSVPLVGKERRAKALARAQLERVRVRVHTPHVLYTTRGKSTGEPRVMVRTAAGWVCDCPGYQYTGYCKHLAAVEARAGREHWKFGDPAPLEQEVSNEQSE